jgi:hypothetical protein
MYNFRKRQGRYSLQVKENLIVVVLPTRAYEELAIGAL